MVEKHFNNRIAPVRSRGGSLVVYNLVHILSFRFEMKFRLPLTTTSSLKDKRFYAIGLITIINNKERW
jgi:hypothetical protein